MGLTASKEVKKPKSKKETKDKKDTKKKLPKVIVKGKKMKGGEDNDNPKCPDCGHAAKCRWTTQKNNKGKNIRSYPYECTCKNLDCGITWVP
jgi:DNA-directed RNA polymerase subunit M/transcription elongation factor TFIIS